jgi:hypothetical protein
MQVLTAPGVMIHEIDKSQYSPAMENTACFIMGFANRGEAYQPQEFTSRTAWLNYYGEPDTEAERYFYAAACEVLNQNGRLYCARLPYDNVSFEKVVAFKYTLDTGNNKGNSIASTDNALGRQFKALYNEDNTIDNVVVIEPSNAPALYDLSAIDEYRTDEAKVPNNTFLIADVAFNSYNRIQEDKLRKDEKRELIGIMPVITTAANAMYTQGLIDVTVENTYNYETIGAIRTLDAELQLGSDYPRSMELLTTDCARILNSRDYYKFITKATELSSVSLNISLGNYDADTIPSGEIKNQIIEYIKTIPTASAYVDDWNGQFQKTKVSDKELVAEFSFANEFDLDIGDPRYGWHNPDGDDDLPDTVSLEANSYFPTINMFTDDEGILRFERDNLKKIGLVVYKMYMDPTEGNKINFEPVEAYAGSLGKDDKDPDTGVTTFLDTIVNSQSEYVNFFSNCFNTKAGKSYYAKDLDLYVVKPPKQHAVDPVALDDDGITDIYDEIFSMWLTYKGNPTGFKGNSFDNLIEMCEILSSEEVGTDLQETLQEYIAKLNEYSTKLAEYQSGTANDDTTASLGFYWSMVKEDISIDKSIYDGINKSFDKVSDINERNIDIVCDAGVANIASYLKAIYGNKGEYDLGITDDIGNSLLGMWKCKSNNSAIKTWKTVEMKYDNFCKNVRKDCMFIADGPRPLVLQGQKKIIRPTKPSNTIDSNILPYLKFITGLNTNYGAGYMDWFEQADDYSGDFFWCPPSIKAMGVYLNTDSNFMYWDAPAGLNRGVISATDVAFSPTMAQAGAIYEKNWNYAINYPQDGIVLEGQKTFQVKPSAFDRVNVRRLFLRLERQAYKVSRYFVYEGNTAYTRQRLVDALDPYFKEAKAGGGIYEYKIKCDESNNTPETIDRNELHCAIGIKPVKTAEFIYIDFVALRTGGSWEEAGF